MSKARSAVVFCSLLLLIREHQRARCQAEIPLTAPSEIVEPPLRRNIQNRQMDLPRFRGEAWCWVSVTDRGLGVVLLVDAVPWFGPSGARSFIPAHAQALPSRTVPVKHARFARPRGLVLDRGEHGGMIGLAGRGW